MDITVVKILIESFELGPKILRILEFYCNCLNPYFIAKNCEIHSWLKQKHKIYVRNSKFLMCSDLHRVSLAVPHTKWTTWRIVLLDPSMYPTHQMIQTDHIQDFPNIKWNLQGLVRYLKMLSQSQIKFIWTGNSEKETSWASKI